MSNASRLPAVRTAFLSHAFISLLMCLALPTHAQNTGTSGVNSEATLTVNTNKVETSRFTRSLSINGTINAWREVVIAAEVGGYRVDDVLVDVGDFVSKGQVLVKMSTALLQTERAARLAAVQQQEAEMMNADLALKRAQTIAAKSLLSEADLNQLESAALSARARLASAQAELEAANVRLQFATVVAPDDGVISARNATMGEIAQAGTEMMRLLRQNRIEWRGEVPESTLPSLKPGQAVTITSVDGREHHGSIRTVSPTVDSITHNGLVYVDLNSDDALRPGMFARGKIEYSESEATLVPLASLVSSDGYNYVFVVNGDGTVSRKMIVTGVIQNNKIEVLSGLTPGANIVINGAGFLKDGDLVNVVEAR